MTFSMSQRQSQLIFTKPDEKHISSEKTGGHSHKRDIPQMCPEHLQSGNVLAHSVLQKAGCNSEFFLFLPPSIRKKVKFAVYIGCSYKTQVLLPRSRSSFSLPRQENVSSAHTTHAPVQVPNPHSSPHRNFLTLVACLRGRRWVFFSPGSISFHR